MVLINRRIGFDVVCNPAPASPCPTCPLLAGRRTRADHLATTCRLSFVGPRLACGLHSSARAPAQEDDHYATLEVPETIDAAGLKRKFYALSKQLHPDRNPGDEAATSRFQAVSAAYSILSDPRTRREYDGKRRRLGTSQPAAPRGSYFSPGRNRFSDSDLNSTRRARATYAWDTHAQAQAKRARDRAEGAAKATSAHQGKGKGFGWGTGGVFEGRGMYPDDEHSNSRFEQLKEREQRMDATLKARVRAAQTTAKRMNDMRLNDDSTSAHAWLFTAKQPLSAHAARMDARERALLFERTSKTREAFVAWKYNEDIDLDASPPRTINHLKAYSGPSRPRARPPPHTHAHRNHRPPPIGMMQTFLMSTAAVVVGSLTVLTIATGPLRGSLPP